MKQGKTLAAFVKCSGMWGRCFLAFSYCLSWWFRFQISICGRDISCSFFHSLQAL